jgi:hypothetical protein
MISKLPQPDHQLSRHEVGEGAIQGSQKRR